MRCHGALAVTVLAMLATAALPGLETDPQEDSMSQTAKGTFDVQLSPEGEPDQGPGSVLARMSLAKTYGGDLEGVATGTMLSARTDDPGSAGYVALERFTGTLAGKQGSFALQHSGTMAGERRELVIQVVPGSGTGELAGIEGTLEIQIEGGKHSYRLEYRLSKPNR